MTKEEHAKQIVEEFVKVALESSCDGYLDHAKACAIIHVDGIIDVFNKSPLLNNGNKEYDKLWGYWQEIKTLIQ